MRGEDRLRRLRQEFLAGSPPHARGRPICEDVGVGRSRITPACAGKTPGGKTRYSCPKDHPRMRGEDKSPSELSGRASGSPPHARGRPGGFALGSVEERITPACAGKTERGRSSNPRRSDHPRMRGEDRVSIVCGMRGLGSPPHARGRLGEETTSMGGTRITPACAGKTNGCWTQQCRWRDHPRMRGEDRCLTPARKGRTGSPPHARGRPTLTDNKIVHRGITPACAGKT